MFHISDGRKAVIVAAAFALTLAACGTSSGSDGSGGASADGPESLEDIEYKSPIADFLGFDSNLDFSSDEFQAQLAEEEAKAQEAIGACMRAQGFEYTPEAQGQFGGFGGEDELAYFSKEWTEKYGFGVSTQRFSQSEVGPDLVGYNDEGFKGSGGGYVDPNEDYVKSLSKAEQNAFYEALYGKEPDIPEGASQDESEELFQDFVPTGCQAEAYGDDGFFGGPSQGFYEEFGQALEDLNERVEADSRVTAHREEVSACLAKDGLEFTTMENLHQDFKQQMGSIGGVPGDPFEGTGLDPEQMTDEEIDQFFQNLRSLSPEDKTKLAEIQADEIELAKAVIGCGGGPLNDQVVLGDIRVEYEQEFLDANADRLGEFKGSTEGS